MKIQRLTFLRTLHEGVTPPLLLPSFLLFICKDKKTIKESVEEKNTLRIVLWGVLLYTHNLRKLSNCVPMMVGKPFKTHISSPFWDERSCIINYNSRHIIPKILRLSMTGTETKSTYIMRSSSYSGTTYHWSKHLSFPFLLTYILILEHNTHKN